MSSFRGHVRDGSGHSKNWPNELLENYRRLSRLELVPGTLNVELEGPFVISATAPQLAASEWGGEHDVFVVPCRINDHAGVIIRTRVNNCGEGPVRQTIVEIASDVRLREKLGLESGDLVTVEAEGLYPVVIDYGEVECESFESYYGRWPSDLEPIPRCVVEQWIYRHWSDFQEWIPLEPHHWAWNRRSLSNDEVLQIGHVGDWIEHLLAKGKEFVSADLASGTQLDLYMRTHGTTPAPIIVAENAGHVLHPKGFSTDFMKEPFQLIEGHKRLARLIGMIDSGFLGLQSKHDTWVVQVPLSR